MVKILLLDAYSAAHMGNTALLDSSMDNLKAAVPEAQFAALAKAPESYAAFTDCACYTDLFPGLFAPERRRGWRLIPWLAVNGLWAMANIVNLGVLRRVGVSISPLAYTFNPARRRAVQALLDAGMVITISGEMLNEVFRKLLPFILCTYWIAQRLGKPMIVFPQSIGPFTIPWLTRLTSAVLRGCDLVMARDEPSFAEARRLGVPAERLHFVPDVAIRQPMASPARAAALLAEAGVDVHARPLIGLTVSDFLDSSASAGERPYLDALARLCEYLAGERGVQLVFLTANRALYGEEQDDAPVAERLYNILSEEARVRVVRTQRLYSAREFKAMAAHLDVFITTRMHAGIMATMAGAPTIALGTQRKLEGYMALIGQAEYAVPVKEATYERLRALVEQALSDGPSIRTRLAAARSELEPRSLEAGRLVRALWNSRGSV